MSKGSHSGHHHHHHHHGHDHASGNIGIAFLLNFSFALIEIVGGILTGSVAILADALHDLGDSFTLALAWGLQKLSNKGRSTTFTYGYGRLSLLSSLISGLVLFGGSILIISQAIPQIWNTEHKPHGLGMMGFALFGVAVNGFAALRLSKGHTRNEKMLTWHLIEDFLGWVAVLIGSIVIYFTGWAWVDALLAVAIALFIGFNVIKNLWETIQLFLQKVPEGFDIEKFEKELKAIKNISNVHDVHVWTMDGVKNILSLHIEIPYEIDDLKEMEKIKTQVREHIAHMGTYHITIEVERVGVHCMEAED
ncbi:MAG: cation diffusion facilitator family transporter [Oligoflexia bacterium]|nr:cation diffusion facilitator family transporter [Oligoflexia bacterium]